MAPWAVALFLLAGTVEGFRAPAKESKLQVISNVSACPDGQVPFKHYVWVGTAPFCNGEASDCPSGYQYTGRNAKKNCWSGTKAECAKSSCSISDTANPQCKPGAIQVSILGTAPFCSVTGCDCLAMSKIPYAVVSQTTNPCIDRANWLRAGGYETEKCHTGDHVICLRDTTGILDGSGRSADLKAMISEERERCAREKEMSHEKTKLFFDLVGKIVTAAAGR